MTGETPWLDASWTFVAGQLPPPPARVLEIGCGSLGGFVPNLIGAGYDAVGIDPQAPEAPDYRRLEVERYRPPERVHAVVACTSLHHLVDLDAALDRVAGMLLPGGLLVLVEWAWERFDEPTARWCFARLAELGPDGTPDWLREQRDEWTAAHQPWPDFLASWAAQERLHTWQAIRGALQARFDTRLCTDAAYFFADLHETSEHDEEIALSAGRIQANGIHYVGTARPSGGRRRS